MTDFYDDDEFGDELFHYGTLRKSGRYPWGSGENPAQRNKDFLDYVRKLERDGLTQSQIAEGMGLTTTQLRANKSIAKNAEKRAQQDRAIRLKEEGNSNIAIGEIMGLNESSVRALLNPALQQKATQFENTVNMLRDQVDKKGMLDIGVGTENHIGVSQTALATAVAALEKEGYRTDTVKVTQLGTGKETTVKVLSAPGTEYKYIVNNKDKIRPVTEYTEDRGRTFSPTRPPEQVSLNRVAVKYGPDGGADKDGVIELRRGVADLDLGSSNYAQVRIAVNGSHYLKGMAVYADDLPDGVDIRFNTNKSDKGDPLKAMKPLLEGPENAENPFGSSIRRQQGALNIIYEEGNWDQWNKNLSSQMLSKQRPQLAKEQLELAYKLKQADLAEINSLTNPAVKKKLLQSYADGVDSSAVHLKAAALPRQRSQVILPVPQMKDTEVYAPNFQNGEKVVLVRHPHGGIFEIPELTVNNRQPDAKKLLGQARDAIGISPKVAQRLSGADFDGDTVLVIPNDKKKVSTAAPLEGLKDFDPQSAYPAYPGMKPMTSKQNQMGDISNLITDMSIQKAPMSEIAQAVRHSMVVIDAEKHNLNYRQSAIDNKIPELKKKYQGRANGGAATLISRSGPTSIHVDERKLRSARQGGPIDPETGKYVYVKTNAEYPKTVVNPRTGVAKTTVEQKTSKVTRLGYVDDARELLSDAATPMERVYADHSNRLKALGNTARKEMLSVQDRKVNDSAKKVYAQEVNTLKAKLNTAMKNKPLERHAQLLANAEVSARRAANPDMDGDELKKIKNQALAKARVRSGAQKSAIDITPREWEAIQAGAISTNFLNNVLDNTDLDKVKQYAMPREAKVMVPAKLNRAKQMLNLGYTQAEIAAALGVPPSTLSSALFPAE